MQKTMEVLVHRFGYRPGETIAAHSRQRYRLVAKAPSTNGPDPDPSLWIVHYSQSDPQHRIPSMNLPMAPQINAALQERRMIERQGQLVRKEFMFKDRANWPDVKLVPNPQMGPTMVPPGPMYPNHMMQQMPTGPSRAAAQYYQQAHAPMMAGPPAKRARQQPPPQMPAGAVPAGAAVVEQDPALYEEHVAYQGDILDNMTPKELSVTRFRRHHLWMDEILSSTFAAEKIQPLDLGLGLSGQLKQITEGVNTATPGPQTVEKDKTRQGRTDQLYLSADDDALLPIPAYQKIGPEQLESVQKRVDKFVEEGEREMEELRRKHARRVADMKRAHKFAAAEAQLKQIADEVMYDESQDASGASPANGTASLAPLSRVDDVTRSVEESLGVMIQEKLPIKCMQKGGLLEEELRYDSKSEANGNRDAAEQPAGAAGTEGRTPHDRDQAMEDDAMGNGTIDGGDLTSGLLDEFMTSTPDATANNDNGSYRTGLGPMQPDLADTPNANTVPMPPSGPVPQELGEATSSSEQQQSAAPSMAGAGTTPLQGEQDGMNLLNDMDLDVDMTGLESEGAGTAPVAESAEKEEDWVLVQEPPPGAAAGAAANTAGETPVTTTSAPADATTSTAAMTPAAPAPDASAAVSTAVEQSTPASVPVQADTPTIAAGAVSTSHTDTQATGTPGQGQEDDFGTFDGLNTAGDALADFTDLDGADFGNTMGTPGQ